MSGLGRRRFLGYLGAAAAAGATASLPGCGRDEEGRPEPAGGWEGEEEWREVRRRFRLDPEYVHLAGLLLASHPEDVAAGISRHRGALDRNPAMHVQENNGRLEGEVRDAAADYLGVEAGDVALTDSTTMGIALVYNGAAVRGDQELLTTTHDYFATHESLRFKASRSGGSVRTIEPFARSADATAGEIAGRILSAVRPETRVLALTWVHSWTGVKIPVRRIADGLEERNAGRAPDDRVLFCLDGVHGLGVEDEDLADLGCDFFMAGTHKWLFGPRGTGILWGRPATQDAVSPTIPTFSDERGWGGRMSPGGFKPFEHRWAVTEAFGLHREIGRSRVTERIRELSGRCKEALRTMEHVRLRTPMDPEVSSGIVSFDVEGMGARAVVDRLREERIIASVTPYSPPHARLAPGLLNSRAEIDRTVEAIDALA